MLFEAHAKHDSGHKDKSGQGKKKNWPHVHGTFVKACNDCLQCLYTYGNCGGNAQMV